MIEARAVVETRTVGAFVDIFRTIASSESRRTRASVIVDSVDTGAPVLAWISHTIVDVLLAEMTGESDWTTAFVSVD